MQFQSETTTVDYYQIENTEQVRLRVVTFLGKTLNKMCIEVHDMAGEIDHLLRCNFAVTINTKRPRQYVPMHKVAQCLEHYRSETPIIRT